MSVLGSIRSRRFRNVGGAVNGAGLLDERSFDRMLALERKRSHRTGVPFVLLIIDFSKLPTAGVPSEAEIVNALKESTRDTDVSGWRRRGSAVGVIFTSLQDVDRHAVELVLVAKMRRSLGGAMSPDALGQTRMSLHFFPEQNEGGDSGFRSDEKLYPDLNDRTPSGRVHSGLKRSLDIAGSLGLLIVLSPLFFLICLLIKATSKGPVLFRQRRIGRFGVPFNCLKFRTMYIDCDHEIHRRYIRDFINETDRKKSVYKIVDDPRVTPIGRLLRKTSLDETPQFVNVLRGEMSLVGPRPPIPYEIDSYRPWHWRRIVESKPGVTGLWQVYGRSRTTFDDMVRLDIRYIEEQSLWLDLKLLLRTPWVVITGSGAY